ncbi:MAG: SDR family NAD(P)-dependent oxidoreductase [Ktedonobacterales bacterium]
MTTSTPFHTALITGASRGLGLALARALASTGWYLILDARGADALESTRAELASRTQVVAIPGDVTDPDHRAALAQAARDVGGLDLLVNNASILGPSPQPALLDYPLDVLEAVYRANVIAPLGMLQALRDVLKDGARVVNITSDAGVEAYTGWGGYGSSKAGLEQMSHILAAENPQWRVYWVDPGDMRTAMHQEAFPGEDISDRPLPEEFAVPGLFNLIAGDYPSGRYQAHALAQAGASTNPEPLAQAADEPVRELRVALTVGDFDRAVTLYRDGLGLRTVESWESETGRGVVLAAGRGTIELLDATDSAYTDEVEVGRHVSGPVRLALEVPDVEAAAASLYDHGGKVLHDPVTTPWAHRNQRVQSPEPEGMQLSLFQRSTTQTDLSTAESE